MPQTSKRFAHITISILTAAIQAQFLLQKDLLHFQHQSHNRWTHFKK